MSYPIAYSLVLPRGARVLHPPLKLARDMKKAHTGLWRAALKASWTDASGTKQKAEIILMAADGAGFNPGDSPQFTSLELTGHFAWAAYRYAYEVFKLGKQERPAKNTEIAFRLDATVIDAEGERAVKTMNFKVNKAMLKAEQAWLELDKDAVPRDEQDGQEEEEEDDDEEDEEGDEDSEDGDADEDEEEEDEEDEDGEEDADDEDEEEDADDEDEEEDEDGEEDAEGEDEEDEEVPKKRVKTKPKVRRTHRRAPEPQPQGENGQQARVRSARERDERVRHLAGLPKLRRGHPQPRKEGGMFFPVHRRPALDHYDRRDRDDGTAAIVDGHVKSEIVGIFEQMNAIEQSRADAMERERAMLRDQYQTMFGHYDHLLAESRLQHGHLHDVTMGAVREANDLTRSFTENQEAHRELNRQGWNALMQGIGLVQTSAQGQIHQERQMTEMYISQLEREYTHQRELAAATQVQPAKPASGIGSMITGAIKELGPMLKPVLGLMLAKAKGDAGDEEGEEEGLTEVGEQVMTMRTGGQPGQPRPQPGPGPETAASTEPPAPSQVPATLPPKPALRRPAPNPYHMQSPVEPEVVVDGPSAEPPINSVILPDGIDTFSLFTERMPIVSRLRLLVLWVTPTQRAQLSSLLADNWNRIVRAAGSKSDGSALSSMVMLLGPLMNDTTRKKIRAIMSSGQNELLDEIERIIRAKFPGLG